MDTTLADLDALLVALPGALPPHGVHAARKALSRIAQHTRQPSVLIAADDLIAKHANFKDAVGKRWYDEASALRTLLTLPFPPVEILRRVGQGEATMRDARTLLDFQDWREEKPRIAGCYQRLAQKMLERGVVFDDLRATQRQIDLHLNSFTHLDFALKKAGWATMKSRIRRLVSLADTYAETSLKASLLSGTWKDLIERASDRGAVAKLWGLLAHCWRHAIEPGDVDDSVVSEYQLELERRGVTDPFSAARDSVYAWERLAKTTPGWPQTSLQRLYRSPYRSGRPRFSDLPHEIQTEWDQFGKKFGRAFQGTMNSLSDLVVDDLFSTKDQVASSFAPDTLRNLRSGIVGLYQAAAHEGLTPKSLAELVDPVVVMAAAKAHFARQTQHYKQTDGVKERNNGLLQVVGRALSIASRVGVPKEVLQALEKLRDHVDPRLLNVTVKEGRTRRTYRPVEIGGRHRIRIAAFNNQLKMYEWLHLPRRLKDQMRRLAKAQRPPNTEAIGDAIVAVLYCTTLCCPMRRRNLAQLTVIGQNSSIWLPPTRKGPGKLHVPAEQVKNNVALYAEFDADAVEILSLWMDWFRPALMRMAGSDPANPYLFPAAGLKHRAPELLNNGFVTRNRKAGFELNLHCQRHLVAKVVLDEDPTQMELVRQLLGHRSVKTTERYYAEVNQILVQRRFHNLLESRRKFIYGELPYGLR